MVRTADQVPVPSCTRTSIVAAPLDEPKPRVSVYGLVVSQAGRVGFGVQPLEGVRFWNLMQLMPEAGIGDSVAVRVIEPPVVGRK